MAKLSAEELLEGLKDFRGTTQWYHHPSFPNYVYTDGVRFMASNAEAYWLLIYIFSNQTLGVLKGEEFQRWELTKNGDGAIIKVGNGNGNILKEFKIPVTDFPLDSFILWLIDHSLILPSEY